MANTIHQEIVFQASPKQVYEALLDGKRFSEATGAPAEIGREEGAEFSCFGGMITGRHVELTPNERIVQAWRVGNWDPAVYSIVRFDLKGEGDTTRLVLDHSGFPLEAFEHLAAGWQAKYWDGLQKYLS